MAKMNVRFSIISDEEAATIVGAINTQFPGKIIHVTISNNSIMGPGTLDIRQVCEDGGEG